MIIDNAVKGLNLHEGREYELTPDKDVLIQNDSGNNLKYQFETNDKIGWATLRGYEHLAIPKDKKVYFLSQAGKVHFSRTDIVCV